jgi:hypothetical protein
MTFFPPTGDPTNKDNKWIDWVAKVLTAESAKTINGVKVDTFGTNSVLSGNQLYGASWAVAFLQALYAETKSGKTPDRADYVKTLLTTPISTPAVLPLVYSATNHQGLTGGYLIKVTGTSADVAVDGVVYTDDPAGKTAPKPYTKSIGAVPTYLH